MNVVWIAVGVVVALALVYFLFIRKPAAPAEKTETRPEPQKAAPKPTPKAEPKAEPKKEQAAQKPVAEEKKVSPEPLPKTDVVVEQPKAAPPVGQPPVSAKPLSKKDVAGLRKGLAATRGGFIARLTALFTGKKEIDPAILEQMEEVMLSSDVGVKTTQAILARLRDALGKNELRDEAAVWAALRTEALRILSLEGGAIRFPAKPTIVLMVGVNGVGKTTSIGKLATKFNAEGKKVILAAGDTFRAAAVQQLEVWGKRVGADVVKGKEGADPGAVAFEASNKAKEAGADLLLVDTAGRLHTKAPLMDEIKKVRKTIAKALEGGPHETLLVLDATTGQNALTQAAMFKEAVDLTGIILTKLDGTAKGGIVLGICDELKVPVRYIGIGERAEDLREFQVEEFVEALFGQGGDEAAAA
jgi:fused signal recognition particle receptor